MLRRTGFTLIELMIVVGVLLVLMVGMFAAMANLDRNRQHVEAAPFVLELPKTQLPPEWDEVVRYLADVQIPNGVPNGWVPAIIVKKNALYAQTSSIAMLAITPKGELEVFFTRSYLKDAAAFAVLLDVGDLILLQPGKNDYQADSYHVVKKFAFIPRDPTKRNE